MFSVKSTVKLDFGKLAALDNNAVAALEMTADALHTEIANAQGKWLRFWLPGGTRQNFCQETFKTIYRRLCGL